MRQSGYNSSGKATSNINGIASIFSNMISQTDRIELGITFYRREKNVEYQ